MEKLVIDRQKWLRGRGAKFSALFRAEDSLMCCLGFVCLNSGLATDDFAHMVTPRNFIDEKSEDIPNILELLPKWIYDAENPANNVPEIVIEMMKANDERGVLEETREQLLTQLFASVGVEIQFIN